MSDKNLNMWLQTKTLKIDDKSRILITVEEWYKHPRRCVFATYEEKVESGWVSIAEHRQEDKNAYDPYNQDISWWFYIRDRQNKLLASFLNILKIDISQDNYNDIAQKGKFLETGR